MPDATREKLLALLKRRALKRGSDFVLSSGERSDFYIDCKSIEVYPEGASLIGQILYEHTKGLNVNAIGGLAVGAVPLVASTAVVCHQKGREIEGFWVREVPKNHGTKRQIEGNLPANAQVVIFDDVVTSGQSALKAIEAVEAVGGKIVKIVALVDRQAGAKQLFDKHGYHYEPIFTKDELLRDEHA